MPKGVYIRTKENTKNVGKFRKGKPSWNKGKPRTWKSGKDFEKGHIPWNKGKDFPVMIGNKNAKGSKHTEEFKDNMSKRMTGDKHPNWIKDRGKLSQRNRQEKIYYDWRLAVYIRDNFKCRLSNNECVGKLQAHHIFSWREHEELRFIINNGITLCHFHHPRKWEEEKRMIPIFQELLSVSEV